MISGPFESVVYPQPSTPPYLFWVQVRHHQSSPCQKAQAHHFYLVIGPIVGGFVAQTPRLGWHFNFWIMLIFSFGTLIAGYLMTPETVSFFTSFCLLGTSLSRLLQYAPVLLRQRARNLQTASNDLVHFISMHDVGRSTSFFRIMRANLSRPFGMITSLSMDDIASLILFGMYSFCCHRADSASARHLHLHCVWNSVCPFFGLSHRFSTTSPFHSGTRWPRIPRRRAGNYLWNRITNDPK